MISSGYIYNNNEDKEMDFIKRMTSNCSILGSVVYAQKPNSIEKVVYQDIARIWNNYCINSLNCLMITSTML